MALSHLVYPSLYEGFGIAPLEAMELRCPVVCSHAGSLREVVGDAAQLFDVAHDEALTESIRTLIESPSRREVLIERGYARTGLFSWELTGAATMRVYHELAG